MTMTTFWIVFFIAIQTAVHACDVGWIRFQSSCYLFHTSTLQSWVESSHFCVSHGSHLARVESSLEKSFINGMIQDMKGQYWLGGTDDIAEGIWIWAATGKNITNNLWFPGQPSNNHATGRDEDCMGTTPGYAGQWNDELCSNKQKCICEKPVS